MFSQLEALLKDERERGAVLGEKLQNSKAELSERLETIEVLKTEMAKHKDVAEKSKACGFRVFCLGCSYIFL